MAYTIRDPLLVKIQDRKTFIERLIVDYPYFVDKWQIEQDEIFKQEASDYADGDKEVEYSILSQLEYAFDDIEDLKNTFYQSMLLIVYSYYESIITLIDKDARPNSIVSNICVPNGIALSKESIDNISFISDDVSIIRNNVCHNNAGTPRNPDKVKRIVDNYSDLAFEDGVVSINGDSFLRELLDREYFVLSELADKLGYKNKTI